MSTLAYAMLTTKRGQSEPTSDVSSYIEIVAGLVPAEVLSLHAVILSFTTTTTAGTESDGAITTITEPVTLQAAFYGLIVLSMVLYIVARFKKKDRFDYFRMMIPPFAFVAWTMLQKATAFDAVSDLGEAPRTLIALFGAVILGVIATALSKKADPKPPPANSKGGA